MALTDKLKAIGDAIREKTGKMDLIPLSDMPNEILNISSGEENPFYYANSLSQTFATTFPENYVAIIRVKKQSHTTGAYTYMFNNAKYPKSIKLICEEQTGDAINIESSFAKANDSVNTSILEIIDLTEFIKKFSKLRIAFQYQTKLKSILGALDLSSCTNVTNWLNRCSSLEDIEFVPNTINISISFQWCSKLSKTSITSAINGLDNSVTGQTITFSKTAVNNAFGINVDDESTYTEEFNILRNSKSNWTFAYA